MSQMRKLINPWKPTQDWHNVRISKDRKMQIKLPEVRTIIPKMKNALGWNDWISTDKNLWGERFFLSHLSAAIR